MLQKPGVPLSRGTLITHCYSDLSFMDFICTLVTRSIQVSSPTRGASERAEVCPSDIRRAPTGLRSPPQAYSGHSGSFSQLRVIFSFYACTIVPALDAVDKISDAIIAKLLPYVQMVTNWTHSQILLLFFLKDGANWWKLHKFPSSCSWHECCDVDCFVLQTWINSSISVIKCCCSLLFVNALRLRIGCHC